MFHKLEKQYYFDKAEAWVKIATELRVVTENDGLGTDLQANIPNKGWFLLANQK